MRAVREFAQLPKWVQRALQVNNTAMVALPDRDKVYRTRIEDVGDPYIAISAPLDRGSPVSISPRQPITLTVIGPSAPVRMQTRVVRLVTKPVDMWVLEIPPVEEMEVIQRRRSVRVPVLLDLWVWRVSPLEEGAEGDDATPDSPNGAGIRGGRKGWEILGPAMVAMGARGPMLKGRALDLSGTGLRMSIKGHLDVGDHVLIQVEFPWNQELISGRVVSQVAVLDQVRTLGLLDPEARYTYGVEFLDIPEPLEDRIYRFIFDRQRELKAKGLI